eukprot:scaffold470_cov194-Amphora_coffeaeformis.AAC.11
MDTSGTFGLAISLSLSLSLPPSLSLSAFGGRWRRFDVEFVLFLVRTTTAKILHGNDSLSRVDVHTDVPADVHTGVRYGRTIRTTYDTDDVK